jgi:eukaryotic-like serine/threonine-protein kinase
MDDNEVTLGDDETPDPRADFLLRDEFDEPWAEEATEAEEARPPGSHRRGMLAGLAGVGVLLAVLIAVGPHGSSPKLPPQVVRDASSSSPATALASGSASTTTPGDPPYAKATSASGSGSATTSAATKTGTAGSLGAGQSDVVTESRPSGDTVSTAAGGVTSSSQTPVTRSSPTTTSPAPSRTTSTTAPAPPRTTTTTAPAPPRTTTTTTSPPTTTSTTLCVLIICV